MNTLPSLILIELRKLGGAIIGKMGYSEVDHSGAVEFPKGMEDGVNGVLKDFELVFKVLDEGRLTGAGCEAVHGWLFHQLRKANPTAASEIHDAVSKPFAVRPWITQHSLARGTLLKFTIGTLSEATGDLMEKVAAAAIGSVVRLNETVAQVMRFERVRFTTYARLVEEGDDENRRSYDVQFITPTSFRSAGVQVLFPAPELVFRSLLQRWNTFSGSALSEFTLPWEQAIQVSRYDLRTEVAQFSTYKILGFVGSVRFSTTKKADVVVQSAVYSLLSFSTFCGVGYKTTMGLGQIGYRS